MSTVKFLVYCGWCGSRPRPHTFPIPRRVCPGEPLVGSRRSLLLLPAHRPHVGPSLVPNLNPDSVSRPHEWGGPSPRTWYSVPNRLLTGSRGMVLSSVVSRNLRGSGFPLRLLSRHLGRVSSLGEERKTLGSRKNLNGSALGWGLFTENNHSGYVLECQVTHQETGAKETGPPGQTRIPEVPMVGEDQRKRCGRGDV